ncbi:MAG: hypothetical protein WCO19_01500 [Candidatus Saccharibacteria bacterium]
MNEQLTNIVDRSRQIAAGLLVASIAITGCSSDEKLDRGQDTTTTIPGVSEDQTLGDLSEAVPVNNADLQRDDISTYNCGGKLRDPNMPANDFNGDYWIKYANDNPELAPKLMSFYDSMMGAEAVDSLLSHGYGNNLTSPDKKITTDDRGNSLAHLMNAVELKTDRTYANFSCKKGDQVDIHRATLKPTINITKGNHIEGVVVDTEGVMDFVSKAKKRQDGSIKFDIIDLGTVKVGNKDAQLFVVAMKAFGCDNPIARLTPRIPTPPKTHIPETPEPTPTTKKPRSPGTTLPDKVPKRLKGTMPHPQPGGGGSRENGDDPQNDSTETGYGAGDVPTYTVPLTPPAPATTAPANVEVGPPRPEAPSRPIVTVTTPPQTPPPALGN